MIERSGYRKDILILRHDNNAAHNLAIAVEINRTAALIIANLDITNVADIDRLVFFVSTHHKVFELVDVLVIDGSAQLVITIGNFNHAPAGFLENFLNGSYHLP